MANQSNKAQEEKKARVKVDKLQTNKETVKDLSESAAKDVKGGQLRRKVVDYAKVTYPGYEQM